MPQRKGQQHHKGKKRPRGWHRSFAGPDRRFKKAMRILVKYGINDVEVSDGRAETVRPR